MKRRWKGRFMKERKHARLQSLSDKSKNGTEVMNDVPEITENDIADSTESGWGIGRRIVELVHLANQMKECLNCKNPLFLHKIRSEKCIGYASILYVDCECGVINSVTTGKSHRPPDKIKKGMPVYDINTKATLAVMHAGVNYRQMNALMATMEVKGLHHSAMMRRRAEIEPHIESVAKESCLSALTEEVNTNDSNIKIGETDTNITQQPEGIFKYDMGWQKRGSGRAYDSKSGVGTLIGNNSGKICAFGVRQSDCRMCFNAQNNDKENVVRQRLYINERQNKLRKIRNKLRKKLELSYKEKKEGKTYQTAIDTTLNQDPSIPPESRQPVPEPLQSIANLVFCDIESGSLHKDCDILQVAACCEQKTFNTYIMPTKQISSGASKVTGLSSQGGVLFLNGSPVTALPMKDAFQEFITWLREIGNVVLVGHNFKVFDFPRLVRGMKKVGLEQAFTEVCEGGVDTLPIFRQLYPKAEKHSQEFLLEHIMSLKYSAHNALDDVISLEKLFRHSSPCTEIITKHSFSTAWGFHNLTHQETTSRNILTIQCLIDKKVVSKQTATKIASSGLCYIHLECTFKESGAEGLVQLLSDNNCGEPRVTANKKILQNILKYFQDK